MLPIEQCVCLTHAELEEQILARRTFMPKMVGRLYPSILEGEIERLYGWMEKSRLDRFTEAVSRDE